MKSLVILTALIFGCPQFLYGQDWDYLVVGFQSNNVVAFDVDTGMSEEIVLLPDIRPRGIAVDECGEIFLGLRLGGKNIIKLVDDGNGGLTWVNFTQGAIGSFGPGMLQFGANGNLYAAGDNAQTVLEFDGETGAQLDSFPVPGANLLGIATSGSALYAAGYFTDKIYFFDLSADPITGVVHIDDEPNLNNPLGIALGPNEILTAVNTAQQNGPALIQQYDEDGSYLGSIYEIVARDVIYDEKRESYFVTAGNSLFQFDPKGVLLNSFTHPSTSSAYGIARYVSTNSCVLFGDVNLDGFVDLLDVAFFIARLTSGEYQIEADVNQDGVVNLNDVEPFIALLEG